MEILGLFLWFVLVVAVIAFQSVRACALSCQYAVRDEAVSVHVNDVDFAGSTLVVDSTLVGNTLATAFALAFAFDETDPSCGSPFNGCLLYAYTYDKCTGSELVNRLFPSCLESSCSL
jgi:hypothetical protein